MMKKVVSLVVIMVFCVSTYAQIVGSRSTAIVNTPSTPTETQWYLRTGLNLMNFAGDDTKDLDKKMGYNVTFGFQKPLGTIGTYWGMEFGLGERGYKYEETDRDDDYKYEYEKSLAAHNLHYSPFTFGWKYEIVDNLKLDLHAGLYASIDYLGTIKEKGYEKDRNYEDDFDESWKMSDWEDEWGLEWNRFDAGLNIGFGVWYDRFNLDFTFQRGFLEVAKDSESYTNNFMIRLGVAF